MALDYEKLDEIYEDFARNYFYNPQYNSYILNSRMRYDKENPEIEVLLREELPKELELPEKLRGVKISTSMLD